MSPGLLLAFWGAAFVLIVVPGPDWAFTLAAGVRDRVVLPAVTGLMLGYAALTGIVAAGVGTLVTRTPLVLTVLTVVGAGYLVLLGARLAARPGSVPTIPVDAGVTRAPWWRRTLAGVGVSGLNPKGLLIFLALLPQFTDADGGWPIPLQIGALGLVFVLTCGAFYSVLGLAARAVLRARPAASRVASRTSGAAMVLVGVLLLAERVRHILG